MQPGSNRRLGAALAAAGLLALISWAGRAGADEPRGLGRLFRFGAGPAPSSPPPARPNPAPTPDVGAPALSAPPASPTTNIPLATPVTVPQPTPPAEGIGPSAAPGQRIVPQSRTSRPVTESDPLVTRVSLIRSNDGNQFGIFLQVFADGTVIDGEGVHRVGRDVLKPIVDLLMDSDVYRLRGHCGAPATDFTEYVHLVVYERGFGKLRANAFSYSGNPQGCDASVRQLHAALDALQNRITRPPTGAPAGNAPASSTPALPASTIPLTTN